MVTVQMTYNGFIRIDATGEDVKTMMRSEGFYQPETVARRLAEAVAGHVNVRYVSLYHKRGVTNRGWRAVFSDENARAAYQKTQED